MAPGGRGAKPADIATGEGMLRRRTWSRQRTAKSSPYRPSTGSTSCSWSAATVAEPSKTCKICDDDDKAAARFTAGGQESSSSSTVHGSGASCRSATLTCAIARALGPQARVRDHLRCEIARDRGRLSEMVRLRGPPGPRGQRLDAALAREPHVVGAVAKRVEELCTAHGRGGGGGAALWWRRPWPRQPGGGGSWWRQ